MTFLSLRTALHAFLAIAVVSTGTRIGAAELAGEGPTSAEASARASELADLVRVVDRRLLAPANVQSAPLERAAAATPGIIRSRLVHLDVAAIRALANGPDLLIGSDGRIVGEPPAYALDLFADSSVTLVKLDAAENDLGVLTVRAVLAGSTPGTATLAIDGETVAGSVRTGGRHYSILAAGDGLHRVFELDVAAARTVKDDGLRHPFEARTDAAMTTAADPLHGATRLERPSSSHTEITLVVAYTAAAASVIPNIKSAISLAVSDTNTAFSNSQISAEIRLLAVDRVAYTENNASMATVLDALTNGTGDFARIQQLRGAFGADLVSVVARTSDSCGLAWLNDELDTTLFSNSSRFGASLVAADAGGSCITSNTLAHEIGHNLGAEHDRFVVTNDQPGPTRFGYGYVDLTGRFRDIMSYDDQCDANSLSCVEVPFFSNPDVSYQGRPLGVAFNQPTAADASRKIRGTLANAARLGTQLSAPGTPVLAVLIQGNGAVTSSPSGINCGDTCSASFSGSPAVSLTATAEPRAVLRAWSGECAGTGPCSVTVNTSKAVTATFDPAERSGPIFSSAQAESQSFVRLYNTGTTAGTVTIVMANAATGAVLGQWTSPSIAAGAAPQYPVTTLEAALPVGTVKPSYYAVQIKPQISGNFQHVLFRPSDGTLTNLSTCEASSTATPTALANVHTTLLDNGYPSSIAITNSGTSVIDVRLGIFDARDGRRLGTYVVPPISANAQLVVTVAEIQTAAGITPPANAFHYVIKADTTFTGFPQHLVNNQRVGVITDMTTTCAFGTLPTAVATEAIRQPGPFFSTAQTESQSFLRVFNTGTTEGTVHVTLVNSANAAVLGRWTSPAIAPGAAPQFAISTLETGLTPGVAKPQYYSALVEAQLDGVIQHVLFRPADGTLTNLSSCNAAVGANATRLANVHTTILDNGYPSSVAISNTGGAAQTATLGVFNAATGARLGTYTSPSIPAGGQAVITVAAIEAGAGITPISGQFHHVIAIEGSFRGFLQHLVNNQRVGVITDMTTACQVAARSVSYTDCSAGFTSACPIVTNGTQRQGQLKKNGAFEYYSATLTAGRPYTIEVKGADSNNGTLIRPNVFVHRSDFSQAASGSLGGTGRDARVTFTPAATGTHYIVIGAFTLTSNGAVTAHPSGTYRISVQE